MIDTRTNLKNKLGLIRLNAELAVQVLEMEGSEISQIDEFLTMISVIKQHIDLIMEEETSGIQDNADKRARLRRDKLQD